MKDEEDDVGEVWVWVVLESLGVVEVGIVGVGVGVGVVGVVGVDGVPLPGVE